MKKLFLILLLFPVLVRAQTSIHIYASATTICKGATVYFTDTVTGDLFPHFQWRVNGIKKGTDSSAFTTDTLANGDTVQCLLTSITADTILARSDSIIMTVQDTPAAGIIAGVDSVCVGSTITLSDSIPGGIWSACNTYATVDSGVVTGVFGGFGSESGIIPEDTIYYTLTNSCGSDTASKIIVVNPLPNASFSLVNFDCTPTGWCIGTCLYVNCGEGAEGYMYATNDNMTCSYGMVCCDRIGADTIINIATNSCGSDTVIEAGYVIGAPPSVILASSTVVPVGEAIILMDSPNVYFPIWSASNGNAVLSDSAGYGEILTGVAVGLVTITLFDPYHVCGPAYSYIVITIDSTTNISQIAPSNDDVIVYPNPSNDELVIHTYVTTYHSCSIISSSGQLILQQTLNSSYTSINISSLQAGTYFITINGDDKRYKGKFIKQQ